MPPPKGVRKVRTATEALREGLEAERLGEREVKVAKRPITVEEFLQIFGEDDDVELVDGVVVERMAASLEHERLFNFLTFILTGFVEKHGLGVVLGSRTLVPITPFKGRLPDILFVRKERLDILGEKALKGAPDLVVEIVSPGETRAEILQRQADYESIGVREFWIVDLPRGEFRALSLNEKTGRLEEMEVKEGVFESKVLAGFRLKVDWLWQKPLPNVVEVLKELGVI